MDLDEGTTLLIAAQQERRAELRGEHYNVPVTHARDAWASWLLLHGPQLLQRAKDAR